MSGPSPVLTTFVIRPPTGKSDDFLFSQLGDLLPVISAKLNQDFLGVLTKFRSFAYDFPRSLAELDRTAWHLYRAKNFMVSLNNVVARQHLWISDQIGQALNRTADDVARAPQGLDPLGDRLGFNWRSVS